MDIKSIIAGRLVEARESAKMTQAQVADALGLVRQTYARFEQSQALPDVAQLITLTKLFDKPLDYFYESSTDSYRIALRADDPDLLKPELKNRLIEKLKNINDIEQAADKNKVNEYPSSMPIFEATESTLQEVEDKAYSERNRLGIGNATCVGDIVSVLESADIRVIPFSLKAEEGDLLSGFSLFSEKYGPAIFVNNHPSIPVERQIFSICHEYAHIIFHRNEYDGPAKKYKTSGRNTSPEEKIANHFAACFLMPRDAIRRQFNNAGGGKAYAETIMRLKKVFRVSAVSVISRLESTRLITKDNSGKLWGYATLRNWKLSEPEPIIEPLSYDKRILELSQKAWFNGTASEGFIADLLELDRKSLASLLEEWYGELEAQDAI